MRDAENLDSSAVMQIFLSTPDYRLVVSASPRALYQNAMKSGHFSYQAEIFRMDPEKSVEQHTKSLVESPWSFPEIQDSVQNGRHLKQKSCMLEIAHNKLTFSG